MRPRLNIMRANKQLYNEVMKYFYKNWRLYIRADCSAVGQVLSDEVCYEGVRRTIDSAVLELLKELEIRVYEHPSYSKGMPSSRLSTLFKTLRLERVRITFDPEVFSRTENKLNERFGKKLIREIPASVSVSWSRNDAAAFFGSTAVEQRLYQALQEKFSSWTGQSLTIPERVVTQ